MDRDNKKTVDKLKSELDEKKLDDEHTIKSEDNQDNNNKYEYGCKLPSSYGQGVYEERQKWVADPVEPGKPEVSVDAKDEWADPEAVKKGGDHKVTNYQYCPLVKAGKNNFFLAPGETLEQCPYEESHQILTQKFGSHLTKCRRNYLKRQAKRGALIEIEMCPHNPNHHIRSDLMENHRKTCEATIKHTKLMAELKRWSPMENLANENPTQEEAESAGPVGQEMEKKPKKEEDNEEDWGATTPVKAFNPVEKLAKEGTCFIVPYGLTRSERKEFRHNETERNELIWRRSALIEEHEMEEQVAKSSKKARKLQQKFDYRLANLDEELAERNEIFTYYMTRTRPTDEWWDADDEQEPEPEPPCKKQRKEEDNDSD